MEKAPKSKKIILYDGEIVKGPGVINFCCKNCHKSLNFTKEMIANNEEEIIVNIYFHPCECITEHKLKTLGDQNV